MVEIGENLTMLIITFLILVYLAIVVYLCSKYMK